MIIEWDIVNVVVWLYPANQEKIPAKLLICIVADSIINSEEVEKTIDDRLLKLSEEFAKFAGNKMNKAVPIDVEAKVVQT